MLFLVAQADSPDYIPMGDTPVYITHRIFLKFSSGNEVTVQVDFAGVVTQAVLQKKLDKKENSFDKNSAFNRNFSDSAEDYYTLGKQGHAGSSNSVARSDHVHPVGTILKFAENNWNNAERENLLPDTNRWKMSNGQIPATWGDFEFDATFTAQWDAFTYEFDNELLESIRGRNIEFGTSYLIGASARLELIVNDNQLGYITESENPMSVNVTIPEKIEFAALRIIIFANNDLHCAFADVYLYDVTEDATVPDDGMGLFFSIRKVLEERLPEKSVNGTIYITEKGNIYLGKEDGSLLPLSKNQKLDGFIKELEKGAAKGVATLDADGKLPEEQLPECFIKTAERGVAKGVATLDADGKLPEEQLPEFEKNTAYNCNFSDTAEDYAAFGKQANAGNLKSVARADHVHPTGTILKFAENHWDSTDLINFLPDTDEWVISAGTKNVCGEYGLDATFHEVWGNCSCTLDAQTLENIRGKKITFGVRSLLGNSARMELIMDGDVVQSFTQSKSPIALEVNVPLDVKTVILRVVIFSSTDMHCTFKKVYLCETMETSEVPEDGMELFFSIRKVMERNLPFKGISGTFYLTEKGNVYFGKEDGTLLPLVGIPEETYVRKEELEALKQTVQELIASLQKEP